MQGSRATDTIAELQPILPPAWTAEENELLRGPGYLVCSQTGNDGQLARCWRSFATGGGAAGAGPGAAHCSVLILMNEMKKSNCYVVGS